MATIKGIFFDQDGTIVDTERDGHRVAFNRAFKEFGFDIEWNVEEYHELLQVAGGKERMRHYLHTRGFGREVAPREEDELIKALHGRKTDIFINMIKRRELPLRPGVKRFMKETMIHNLALGICTTSNTFAALAVAQSLLSDINFDLILAGDMVSKKKPDPEIYQRAFEETHLEPEECLVIEDSQNGILAAKAAGLHVVATVSTYTYQEDLSAADIIVTNLGDPAGDKGRLLQSTKALDYDGVLTVQQLIEFFK